MAEELQLNGVRLQYVERGSGEPIVFGRGAASLECEHALPVGFHIYHRPLIEDCSV